MSRAKRVLLTGVWGVSEQVVTILYQVATVPLFLRVWGQDTYGDWLTIASLVAYLMLANLGMQSYVVNLLTQHYVKGMWDELRGEVASASLMFLMAAALALVALGAVVMLAPVDSLFPDAKTAHTGRLVTLMLGARVIFSILTNLFGGFYRVQGLADYAKFAHFMQRAAILAAVFVVLLMGLGPVTLAVSEAAAVFLLMLGVIYDTRRRDPRVGLHLRGASLSKAVSFLGPSLLFFFDAFAAALVFQGIIIVIRWQLGPRAVVTFSTSRVLANIVRQGMAFIETSMYPEITRIEAGKPERMPFTYSLLLKVIFATSYVAVAILFFAGKDLYAVWIRGHATMDEGLMRLLLADVWGAAPVIVSVAVIYSTNKTQWVWQVSLRRLMHSVCTLATVFVALKPVGLWTAGAALAGFNFILFTLSVPRWCMREVGVPSVLDHLRNVYVPYVVNTAVLMTVSYLVTRPLPGGMARLVGATVGVCLAAVPLFWFYALDREERGYFVGLVRAVVRKLRGKKG